MSLRDRSVVLVPVERHGPAPMAPHGEEDDMAFAPEGVTPAKLWARYQGLSPAEKLVIRLKAMIGSSTNKTAFVSAMVATHSRAADGRAWTIKSVNEVSAGLQKLELLDDGFTCPKVLLHPLAVDAAGGPDAESLIAAVRSTFPDVSPRAYAYLYSELWAKLGDGSVRKAAYRGGWKPA